MAEIIQARNRYPLAAIAADAKLEKGVSDNRLLRWESEMDVASGRSDDVASDESEAMISARESMRCRHCGTTLQHSLIDLGMSPLCESFITEDQLDAPETYYPLHARVCHSCWLVQLPEFVSPAQFCQHAVFLLLATDSHPNP